MRWREDFVAAVALVLAGFSGAWIALRLLLFGLIVVVGSGCGLLSPCRCASLPVPDPRVPNLEGEVQRLRERIEAEAAASEDREPVWTAPKIVPGGRP